MVATQRDLLFWFKTLCFASKNHRWGLRPIETSYSESYHVVFHAQNDRWGLRPIETCNSAPKVAVLHAKNHRWGLETICDLICENRPLPAFWRSGVITAVLVPRHLGTRRKILKAIGLTLVEIYSKVFVVLDKYFRRKCHVNALLRYACQSPFSSAFINRIQQNTCFF